MRDDDGYQSVGGGGLFDWMRRHSEGGEQPPAVVPILIAGGVLGLVLEAFDLGSTKGFSGVFGATLLFQGLLFWRAADWPRQHPVWLGAFLAATSGIAVGLLMGPLAGGLAAALTAGFRWWFHQRNPTPT